jgi:hypothetical protein
MMNEIQKKSDIEWPVVDRSCHILAPELKNLSEFKLQHSNKY